VDLHGKWGELYLLIEPFVEASRIAEIQNPFWFSAEMHKISKTIHLLQ
jgi:hypothetical protein